MGLTIDELARRNATFAAGGGFEGLPFPSNETLRIVSCVDSRVDPSVVLGLELGDAVELRTIGGRITPAVLRSWKLLAKLGAPSPERGVEADPPQLIILQHTACGIARLAAYPELLAEFFEIPVSELDSKAVGDPYEAVAIDVEIASRALPALSVSGLVYDTSTGRIEVVRRAAAHGGD